MKDLELATGRESVTTYTEVDAPFLQAKKAAASKTSKENIEWKKNSRLEDQSIKANKDKKDLEAERDTEELGAKLRKGILEEKKRQKKGEGDRDRLFKKDGNEAKKLMKRKQGELE
mgnify:FL=1